MPTGFCNLNCLVRVQSARGGQHDEICSTGSQKRFQGAMASSSRPFNCLSQRRGIYVADIYKFDTILVLFDRCKVIFGDPATANQR